MRILAFVLVVLLAATSSAGAKTFSELFPTTKYDDAQAQAFVSALDYQQGEIKLPEAKATLTVPAGFYFLGPADARKVLVDSWGNPPETATGLLGMLFPASMTPLDSESWGATVTYLDEGYVADDDAKSIDYDEMLANMKESTLAGNEDRTKAGYDSITLIGWASPPYYDQPQHKLHWAKELKFGNADINTVNYDVRVLGRLGVLELSFITDMNHLTAVKAAIPDVLAMASFDQGSRYEDFDSSIDKVAGYGIAALIGGAVAQKAGLFALALVFLKKVAAIAVIGVLALLGGLRKLLTGRSKPEPPGT